MTFLFLIENAGGGGAESFVATLAGEYIKRGHRCVLCFSRPGPLSERAEELGLKTVQLGLGRKDFFRAPEELAKACREFGVDVIHAQFPRENVLAVRAAKRCPGVKVVYTDHMSVPQGAKWKLLNRIYCRGDEFVAAVWEGGREVLRENGVPEEKIRVVRNGARIAAEGAGEAGTTGAAEAARKVPRTGYRIPGDVFLICTLTRLSREKGPDVLVDALAELKSLADKPFYCVIAGEGPMQAELSERIKALGLEDRVLLAGRLEDSAPESAAEPAGGAANTIAGKADLLAAAALYVNSSRSEAMSMAVLEAALCGLPMVLTDVGAARELGCALLVPPEDPKALAEAIARVMADDALRRELSEKSEKTALLYSPERMAEAYLCGGKNDR